MVFSIVGRILLALAVALLPSMGVALYFGESVLPFLCTAGLLLLCGLPLLRLKFDAKRFYGRDGFTAVSLCWLLLCSFGALPFVFSGAIPNYVDALFETVSGFTTTGATILTDIEALPQGLLFWRSFTHWLGGMGVLVLVLAALPSMGSRAAELMRAESPGPTPARLAPRLGDTAKILYIIYLGLTALNIIALLLCGVDAFDAWIVALGTAGTGGFSNLNASMAGLDNLPAEIVTSIFMFIFGMNFSVHYLLLRREWRSVLKDEELRAYFLIVLVAVALITIDISPLYAGVGEALRHSSFQVSSVITTTGYSSTNFNVWPGFSRAILLLLMVIGASAGSTGGGLKVVRVVVIFKALRMEVGRILHPHAIKPLRMDGHLMDKQVTHSIITYVAIYMALWMIAFVVVSLQGLSIATTLSATISCISNIGPAFDGAYVSYAIFSPLNKILLSLCMLLGRLEILPFLLLFASLRWKTSQ